MTNDSGSRWKTLILVGGGVAGLIFGLGAAYLYVRSVEAEQGGHAIAPRPVKPSAAMSLGFSLLVLLRQIAGLGAED